MKRRYKALIAIIVPVAIVYSLKYTNEQIYQWLMGYMVAVALVFKSSLISLWFASKLKLISFIKSLTLFQGILLIIKRWFLDNVITVWIKKHIIAHLKDAIDEIIEFYLHLNLKAKLLDIFKIISLFLFIGIGAYIIGYFDKLLFFAQIKLLASGIFHAIVTFSTKITTTILSWFASSWMAPILEVFALSYILALIEKIFGINNPISRFFNFIGDKINSLFYFLGIFKEKHIDPIVECQIVENTKKINQKLQDIIQNKKILQEYKYLQKLESLIQKGHIDSYYSFKEMYKIKDKKELYRIINEKTNDNIEIVAYISRNSLGTLLESDMHDDFRHDIFFLESFASNQEHGVKTYQDDNPYHIDHTDFWVLNTSRFPLIIGSESNNFEKTCIMPHSLRLIKTKHLFSYSSNDIYGTYQGVKVYAKALV
jgi:hypothetical protein